MNEETLNLEQEAVWVRNSLEQSDKRNIPLITEDFPIMNCKLSSMLVAYHLILKYPNLTIHGVSGRAKNWKGVDEITHYWLEVGKILIDITSDQYNKIDIDELNGQFASYIPFKSVHVGPKNRQPQYYLFKEIERDVFIDGFSDICENLEISYRHLNCR